MYQQIMLLSNFQNNLNTWNKKKYIAGVVCDLPEAFDCVNHELLAHKLQVYSVRGVFVNRLKSYLLNRKQRIELKILNTYKHSSSCNTIKCRVPQGSVLDPLPFNINVNDFPGAINKLSQIIMFADDTRTLTATSNYDELICISNFVLQHISKWFQSDRFVLHVDKTNTVQLTPNKVSYYTFNLMCADQVLPETDIIKFFGLQMDSHLMWKTHINSLLNTLSTVHCNMRRLSCTLNSDTLWITHYAHFHTLIKYGIIFWGTSTTKHMFS